MANLCSYVKEWPTGHEAASCPDEAAFICEAAEHVLGGGSLRSISAEWNRRGIPTAYRNKWTGVMIRAVLRQPRNTGLRQHRGVVIGEAAWPPII